MVESLEEQNPGSCDESKPRGMKREIVVVFLLLLVGALFVVWKGFESVSTCDDPRMECSTFCDPRREHRRNVFSRIPELAKYTEECAKVGARKGASEDAQVAVDSCVRSKFLSGGLDSKTIDKVMKEAKSVGGPSDDEVRDWRNRCRPVASEDEPDVQSVQTLVDAASVKLHTTVLPKCSDAVSPRLVDTPWSGDSLSDAFVNVNEGFRHRLREMASDSKTRQCGTVTLVSAPAGAGKSFLAGYLSNYQQSHLNAQVVRLEDLVSQSNASQMRPDLVGVNDSSAVFNSLGYLEPSLIQLGGNLDQNDVLVLDGLDELSRDMYVPIVRDAVSVAQVGCRHLIVFSRPEAIYDYLADPHRPLSIASKTLVVDMMFPDPYSAHVRDAFFKNYELYNSVQLPDDVRQEVSVAVERFVDVRDTFASLMGKNHVIGYFLNRKNHPPGVVDERSLKDSVLQQMLERNEKTHGRPSSNTEIGKAYRLALAKIAADFASKQQSDGSFIVNSTDMVSVEVGDRDVSLRVVDVLDRSGLVALDPLHVSERRYRFEPRWVGRHLVERYQPEYRGCW